MAEYQKKEVHGSRLLEILKKEGKWENYALGAFSLLACVASLLLITGTWTIDSNFPVLGEEVYGKIFSWTLFALSILGMAIILAPFVAHSWVEVKKVEWPRGLKFFGDLVRVLVFTIIITAVLFVFDQALNALYQFILELFNN
jgi:preprotein translocase subunit SecE